MEAEERQQIKERILEDLESTRQQVLELEALTQPIAPDDAIGRLSRMEAINNKSVNEALLSRTQAKLNSLESALSAVDQEGYGSCRSCGQDIPLGRLMMMPEAQHCVECG